MVIRDRIKELRRVPASELQPNPRNWRTHPQGQLDAIRGILAEVGFAGAELAWELPDGTLQLIDGHARASVAGDAVVPVLVLDVTEQEADKLLATFDPIGAMAGADDAKLRELHESVYFTDAALMCMVNDVAAAAHLAEGIEQANRELYDDARERTSRSESSGESSDKPRQQTLFPLSIVVDRGTKERWDFFKLSEGITKDGDAFAKLLESIP